MDYKQIDTLEKLENYLVSSIDDKRLIANATGQGQSFLPFGGKFKQWAAWYNWTQRAYAWKMYQDKLRDNKQDIDRLIRLGLVKLAKPEPRNYALRDFMHVLRTGGYTSDRFWNPDIAKGGKYSDKDWAYRGAEFYIAPDKPGNSGKKQDALLTALASDDTLSEIVLSDLKYAVKSAKNDEQLRQNISQLVNNLNKVHF